MNQRPYAYDHEYLTTQIESGFEVNVDGKQYRKGGTLPSQTELDALMKRDGLEPKNLGPIDPLVPHGEPNQPTPAEAAKAATAVDSPAQPTSPGPLESGRGTKKR